MILEALRLGLAVAVVGALGFLLVQAAFPPRRSGLSWFERAYLAAAGGTLIVVLVGVVLGFLPHGKRGYFTTFATGFPNVELALAGVGALLLFVGVKRGAFPRLAARFTSAAPTREGAGLGRGSNPP